MDAVHSGGLGGTYGGNPVACAAALGAIEVMQNQDLNSAAQRLGKLMLGRLEEIARIHPTIGDIRGRGAMIAVELIGADGRTPDPARAAAVSTYCHSQGVLTLTCGTYGNVLRFLPPLVISEQLLAEAMDVLSDAFAATA